MFREATLKMRVFACYFFVDACSVVFRRVISRVGCQDLMTSKYGGKSFQEVLLLYTRLPRVPILPKL